mmetsp:Transcript_9511/g.19090  ORF Transcript_9511/g.19090 Transcript_9511/m.19090 type:complete len:238 (-) Transcript_9511:87-800(-)
MQSVPTVNPVAFTSSSSFSARSIPISISKAVHADGCEGGELDTRFRKQRLLFRPQQRAQKPFRFAQFQHRHLHRAPLQPPGQSSRPPKRKRRHKRFLRPSAAAAAAAAVSAAFVVEHKRAALPFLHGQGKRAKQGHLAARHAARPAAPRPDVELQLHHEFGPFVVHEVLETKHAHLELVASQVRHAALPRRAQHPLLSEVGAPRHTHPAAATAAHLPAGRRLRSGLKLALPSHPHFV